LAPLTRALLVFLAASFTKSCNQRAFCRSDCSRCWAASALRTRFWMLSRLPGFPHVSHAAWADTFPSFSSTYACGTSRAYMRLICESAGRAPWLRQRLLLGLPWAPCCVLLRGTRALKVPETCTRTITDYQILRSSHGLTRQRGRVWASRCTRASARGCPFERRHQHH
jgi:hypothetical protein